MKTPPKHERESNGYRYERSALTIELRARSSQALEIIEAAKGGGFGLSRNLPETPLRPASVPFRGIGVNTGLPVVAGLGHAGAW